MIPRSFPHPPYPLRRAAALAVIAAVLALPGCGRKKSPKPPPPAVQVAHPVQSDVRDWDEVVGRFVSIQAVDVRPRVSGYLQSVNFRDGQDVAKDQLLFVVDPRPYQATLDRSRAAEGRARATLATANVELERARNLFRANAASQQDVQTRLVQQQQAAADLASARADTEAAALNVQFCFIRAAVAGRASDRKVNPGNLVTADQTVLTSITTLDPIRFAFEAPEDVYLSYVQNGGHGGRGAAVEVKLQNEPDYRHKGHVEFVDNQVSATAGTIRGRAVLPNPDKRLTPGLFGQMRISGGQAYRALLVPDGAVQQDQSRELVQVVDAHNRVRQLPVETGPLVNGYRVIRSGLKPDLWVVVAGRQKAKPGEPVRVLRMQLKPPPQNSGTESPKAVALPDAAAGIVVGG